MLNELRHISDSADGLKRNRGRRGLDILNKIQKELLNESSSCIFHILILFLLILKCYFTL